MMRQWQTKLPTSHWTGGTKALNCTHLIKPVKPPVKPSKTLCVITDIGVNFCNKLIVVRVICRIAKTSEEEGSKDTKSKDKDHIDVCALMQMVRIFQCEIKCSVCYVGCTEFNVIMFTCC